MIIHPKTLVPAALGGDGGPVSPLEPLPALGRHDDGAASATSRLESTAAAGHGLRCGLETEVSGGLGETWLGNPIEIRRFLWENHQEMVGFPARHV